MLPGRTPKADISFFIHLSFSRTWLSRCESDSRILSFVIYMVPERIFYLTPKWEIIQIIVISWDCNWLYYYFFCDNIYFFFCDNISKCSRILCTCLETVTLTHNPWIPRRPTNQGSCDLTPMGRLISICISTKYSKLKLNSYASIFRASVFSQISILTLNFISNGNWREYLEK